MFNVELPVINEKKYELMEFGILSNSPFENQSLIQKAIDYISENNGGVLVIPRGIIKTGPIELKSKVELHLSRGCVLKFPKIKELYPVVLSNWEGIECLRCVSPISAKDATDIAITGPGLIDGEGEAWRPVKDWKLPTKVFEKKLSESPYYIETKEAKIWYPSKSSYEGALLTPEKISLDVASKYWDLFRPVLINIINCNRVLLDSFTASNSAAWNIHPIFTNNLTVSNLKVKNPYWAQNGDGIDIESCKNVHVFNSIFEVGDDGICLKSGKNRKAREVKIPTENVYIHDCLVYHAHGGIVIGSEMSRGIKNVVCKNCEFIGTDIGIRFKSALGRGGVVEDIKIENILMDEIINEAIVFTMEYANYKMDHEEKDVVLNTDKDDIPYFRNINMKNVNCLSAKKSFVIKGITSDTISNITLEDSIITANEELSFAKCKNIKLINTKVKTPTSTKSFENEVFNIE